MLVITIITINQNQLLFRLKSQLQGGTSGEKKPILVVLEEIPASMLSQVNFFDMLVVLASIIS